MLSTECVSEVYSDSQSGATSLGRRRWRQFSRHGQSRGRGLGRGRSTATLIMIRLNCFHPGRESDTPITEAINVEKKWTSSFTSHIYFVHVTSWGNRQHTLAHDKPMCGSISLGHATGAVKQPSLPITYFAFVANVSSQTIPTLGSIKEIQTLWEKGARYVFIDDHTKSSTPHRQN
jgi:hypothetical protein